MNITHAEFSAAQRLFEVAGAATYSLQEMLAANRDDESLCDWLRQAEPGDEFRDGEGWRVRRACGGRAMNAMNSPDLPIRDCADFLIGCIELSVKHIEDPRERLARQVGMLQSEVLRLSAEVDALRRDEVATEEQS